MIKQGKKVTVEPNDNYLSNIYCFHDINFLKVFLTHTNAESINEMCH